MTDHLDPETLTHAIAAAEGSWESWGTWEDVAKRTVEAYLAAAQPRTVETVEQLDALPFESIVLDQDDDQMKRVANGEGGAHWVRFGDTWAYRTKDVVLPATVLWTPMEGGGE